MCLVFSDRHSTDSFSSYVYGRKAVTKTQAVIKTSGPVQYNAKIAQRLEATNAMSAYIYGRHNAQIGHFQRMEAAKFVQGEDRNRVQHIKAGVSAKIDVLKEAEGYGYLRVGNERLFFHQSQLIGCHISELQVADCLKFDIVFNPRTNKFLAKSVKFVAPAPVVPENGQIGHFQSMQTTSLISARALCPEPKKIQLETNCRGKIVSLAGDYGFLEVNQERVFFHYTQLVQTHISELAVGDQLEFNLTYNKTGNRKVAEMVKKSLVVPESGQIGHFQCMQVASLASAAPEPTKIKLGSNCTGKIIDLGRDYGFLEVNQERVFFHYTQLVQTHMSELAVGDQLEFNLTYNKIGNRKVAEMVKKSVVVPESGRIGHFQCMQVASLTSAAPEPTTIKLETNCHGKIVDLGRDYGFLEVNQERVFFHYTQLVGTHMSELKVGDQLDFGVTFNKISNRKVAEEVRKSCAMEVEEQIAAPIRCSPLESAKQLLQIESTKLLRRLSQNLVINIEEPLDMECDDSSLTIKQESFRKDSISLMATAISTHNSRRNSRRGSVCTLIR